MPAPPRIPLTPQTRRAIAFLALVLGALVFLRVVAPATPREISVRVRLSNFRDGALRARALRLRFERDGQLFVQLRAALPEAVPLRFERTVSLVPTTYRAVVEVELADRVLTQAQQVQVVADEPLELQAPRE